MIPLSFSCSLYYFKQKLDAASCKDTSALSSLAICSFCLFEILSRVSMLPYSKDFLSQHYSIPNWQLSNPQTLVDFVAMQRNAINNLSKHVIKHTNSMALLNYTNAK